MEKSENKQHSQGFPFPHKDVRRPQPLKVDQDNKYVLGGYFSLGLNNFYKTVLLVFAKAGIPVVGKKGTILYEEEKIGQVLNTLYKCCLNPKPNFEPSEEKWVPFFKLNVNQQMKLHKLLFKHFPILSPIMADEAAYKANKRKKSKVTDTFSMTLGVSLSDCLKVIGTIAQGLVDCRNADVHFDPYNSLEDLAKQYMVQQDIVRYLVKALVASRRLDKEQNNIETEKMEFLTGYATKKSLEGYIQKWGFYPKYEQQIKKDKDGNPVYVEVTDKDGNPKKDKNGNPIYKQQLDRRTGKRMCDRDGNPIYEVQKVMVERSDFFYKIGGETTIEKNGKVYSTLTGFGLCYFCTIFLSKPQARQMLQDIRLFEHSPYPEELNNIIRDMLSIYRIRTPRGKKLDGSNGQTLLALDILNELRKCPKELYDVLSPEGQKEFEDEVVHENERTPEVVKRFRSTDRFPFLALKYIDETKLFSNIRFQVQLGKLRFKFYDKPCINGETDVRSWQKDINGFGRLQEIEEKRKQIYKDWLQASVEREVKIEGEDISLDLLQFEQDTAMSRPYITDSRASYNIHNNRIGLYWVEGVSNGHQYAKGGDYLPDLSVVKDGDAPVEMPAPMAMLSIYELPALFFYQYLQSATKDSGIPSAEDFIIMKCRGLRQLFLDISQGGVRPVSRKTELMAKLKEGRYGLTISDIPEKLRDYLLSKAPQDINQRKLLAAQERLRQRLQKAIRRRNGYEEDRKKIGTKTNNFGKASFVDVRHGSLARYLSESFLEWQPTLENGKGKLTGMNFSKLQAELATFVSPDQFDDIRQMLEEAHLLTGSIAHPFLKNIMGKNVQNIEHFYLLYLNEEIRHLRKFFDVNEKIADKDINFDSLILKDPDYSKLPFIKGKARWEERTPDYYRKLAQRYLEVDGKRAAVCLPDGMFADGILNMLKTNYADNEALQAHLVNEELTHNVAYLIRVFFEDQLKDQSQPFYASAFQSDANEPEEPSKFAHHYDLFDILNGEKVGLSLVPVYLSATQINTIFTWKELYELHLTILKKTTHKVRKNGREEREVSYETVERDFLGIKDDIMENVRNMQKKDMGSHSTLQEAKDARMRKLTKAVRDVKNNERAIRRYKTQDMILFLMAEQLLKNVLAMPDNGADGKFKLRNVCKQKFLANTIDVKFPFPVEGENVFITQQNVALKNYGEFYQLLSDDRLPSLLAKLVQSKKHDKGEEILIDYSSLMGELTSYNTHRSRIFWAIHQLERFIVTKQNFAEFLNNPSDMRFFVHEDRGSGPKRNNFRSLLELLEEADIKVLTPAERELIIAIRNAFSHNHYGIDFSELDLDDTTLLHHADGAEAENGKKKLTTIATLIVDKLLELQEKVKVHNQ